MTCLAWNNLTHNWRRLIGAVGGIGFAVVLMFAETGFRHALFDSTAMILLKLDGELVIASKAFYSLLSCETFSQQRLKQAVACPGVQGAYPLYIEFYRPVWKGPEQKGHAIRLLAFHPHDQVLTIPEVNAARDVLREEGTALFDVHSKRKYGMPDQPDAALRQRGAELSDRAVRVVGLFPMGTDFLCDGTAITSAENFAKYCPYRAPGGDPCGIVDLGVVKLQPGADPSAVQARLRTLLPDDVAVYTKSQIVRRENDFWNHTTPIGYVFLLGTVIGFLVGVIVCYQVIYADIHDHLTELATLKAVGYGNSYFIGFVLQQSLLLSVLSFVPGLAVSLVLYQGLATCTGLLMVLTPGRAAIVFLLTAAMCIASGCLAMRKVLAADPAELFK